METTNHLQDDLGDLQARATQILILHADRFGREAELLK